MDWIGKAKEAGFTEAGWLRPATLKTEQWVRDTCASDKCHAYGHNWTCPPECGDLESCQREMAQYSRGILLQTVGHLARRIDAKAYAETEMRHLESFQRFVAQIRKEYPDALCLGAGGCRVCKSCAYPNPCRFPEKACSSMEAYGLFVTKVCKENQMPYYYGPQTITYTACVLFEKTKEQ